MSDLSGQDLVVPLELDDYEMLWSAPGVEGKSILPSRTLVGLCDDKFLLDESFSRNGFDDLRPGDPLMGRYPYVAKRRHGVSGDGVVIVTCRAQEKELADFLSREDVFTQRFLADRFEYAAHFVIYQGRLVFQQTVRHEMPVGGLVKGEAARTRRSRPVGPDPFVGRFMAFFEAIGYEGSACVDYKIEDGLPRIMEINPRIGGSLLRSINDYLDASLVALGMRQVRGRVMQGCVRQRRLWFRRARRVRCRYFKST
ncbi:MAG: hypothetical protein B0D96_11350 [Candidatus Sedimenticola endophacoides]|uniref:ATP-grasp domain-containing protein n=1 Tax=Candidatus Sedimenticola endophacoides TaxID=2548426 RepID=A0A657PJZ3_9GAMM|nr:MAG: hypothetical protein B0D94_10160 [Candidatus Sedimenticola endophacoides]OQX33594.1 MAG: hypothetical protein B0D96_11350 [Candidatus Sedimenticola endophacoides]OQX34808.1 MAG: hypothetical protein B0D84_03115 [Candidatus Sedimenticola endophacoides]OQX38549.1 MAG: hypothetical protein B0D89_12520 [Candidatus Sedimenticola endophacoides]OQX39050.1 MAG: hypothetical protein B0D88_09705 [Candidatus Sedimenticola endophacoides]